MTSIWHEVFPVTLVSQQVVLIRHHQEQHLSPLMIPNRPLSHPNQNVVQHLLGLFGAVFNPGRAIVHSTSWRYEHEQDGLFLTYLAVLPQGQWVDQLIAAQSIHIEPVGAVERQYGDHLFPPTQIKRHSVLAHALDHLASLSTYDPAIQAALEPEWRVILQARMPKAAGCLQGCC